jgi:hypothetical protein
MRISGFHISLILILFYGITPYLYINILNYGKSEYYDITYFELVYSILTVFSLLIFNKIKIFNFKPLNNSFWLTNNKAIKFYPLIFIFCFISFYFNPWNNNREGFLASISAMFRILWILISIPLLKSNKSKIILFLSVILMFVDGSRTFVFVIFLYYLINNKVNKKFIIIGFVLVLLSASFRNGFYSFDLLYGIFGEGVNGSSGIFQVIQLPNSINFQYFLHILYTFFEPLFVIFSLFIPSSFLSFDSSQFLGSHVSNIFDENYYPMGGFYILSEFVYYGYFGVLLFIIYYFISFKITSLLLDNENIKFSPALLFMLIKSSPYTYWKWVIWFFIFQFILKKIFTNFKYA